MSTQRTEISHKNGAKDMIPCNADYYKDEHSLVDESIATLPRRSLQKDHAGHNKNQLKPAELILGGSDSNGSRECWIKTDADCKCSHIHNSILTSLFSIIFLSYFLNDYYVN